MRVASRLPALFLGVVLLAAAQPSAAQLPTLIDTWGTFGSGPGQFNLPGGIYVDVDYVYVADQSNNRIQKFTHAGALVAIWGQQGNGPGDLYHPTRIHRAANGELYVVEHQNHRVSRFSTTGTFLGSFGSPGQALGRLSHPVGITSDPAGNVYVAEATNHRIQKFTASGTPIQVWGSFGSGPGQMRMPYGIELGPDGLLYVSEYDGDRVQVFTTSGGWVRIIGSAGTGPGQFNAAESVAFDSDGNFYAADAGNDRIQKFDPSGAYLGEFAVPVGTESERRPIPCDVGIGASGDLYVLAAGSARVHKYGFAGENRPPDCSQAAPSVSTLWPPNHHMVPVGIVGVTDPDGDQVEVHVAAVTQDEPVGGGKAAVTLGGPVGSANHCPDAAFDGAGGLSLRAERLGQGNGRVYEVAFGATDGNGNSCKGTVRVCVPHNYFRACVDDGQVVSSLGPCGSPSSPVPGPWIEARPRAEFPKSQQ